MDVPPPPPSSAWQEQRRQADAGERESSHHQQQQQQQQHYPHQQQEQESQDMMSPPPPQPAADQHAHAEGADPAQHAEHADVMSITSIRTGPTLQIDNYWDRDSALGGMSNPSSTQSVTESIYDHVVENGRTYHRYKEGKYMLPNDESERDRLDFQHRIYTLYSEGKLFMAPIDENVRNVLDVATGTGIWAIEFGRDHPGTNVLGTDLSPIQPDFAPPNVSFEICDAEDEWSFSQKFDLIHMRAVVTCFMDPKAVFKQAFDALQPGGWLELRDPIMPFQYLTPPPEPCALKEWSENLIEAARRTGRTWTNAQHYSSWLREFGAVGVVEAREHVGLNPWMRGSRNKHLASLLGHDMSSALESMSMALFTRVLGWEPGRVRELLARAKADMLDTNIHAYSEGVHVIGQKPLDWIDHEGGMDTT